ncbi:MAG: hypothetical protein ACRC6T_14610 [Sarcina sp.]
MFNLKVIFLIILFFVWVSLIKTFSKSRKKTIRKVSKDKYSYKIISKKPYSLIASTLVMVAPTILLMRIFSK